VSAGSIPDVRPPAPGPGADGQSSAGGRGLLARLAPLRRSLRTEAGSAGLLLAATVVALLWANSPMGDSYDAFWHTEFAVRMGGAELVLDLQHWVNDGLMVFFFFVVGLEIKRELVIGELTDRRRAAVPAVAAVTGLAVPALVYVAFNLGDEAAAAWGVVISTDTAFLLGVLALVGPACPAQLRLFLLTLAIADDVGALTVIALFYTEDLRLTPLALSVLGLALMVGLRYLKVWRGPAYMVLGIAVWVAMYQSGVHPTLAGVVIALFTPAYAARRDEVADAARLVRAYQQSPNPQFARAAAAVAAVDELRHRAGVRAGQRRGVAQRGDAAGRGVLAGHHRRDRRAGAGQAVRHPRRHRPRGTAAAGRARTGAQRHAAGRGCRAVGHRLHDLAVHRRPGLRRRGRGRRRGASGRARRLPARRPAGLGALPAGRPAPTAR
jgi:Na+/H+ antiporter NhaA